MITVPVAAAGIAVAAAMAAMSLLRCLHPPGAALALSAALGGPALAERACQLVLAPVIVNTIILLTTAIGTGRISSSRRIG
jgi:CBS domain-containing membrane protein